MKKFLAYCLLFFCLILSGCGKKQEEIKVFQRQYVQYPKEDGLKEIKLDLEKLQKFFNETCPPAEKNKFVQNESVYAIHFTRNHCKLPRPQFRLLKLKDSTQKKQATSVPEKVWKVEYEFFYYLKPTAEEQILQQNNARFMSDLINSITGKDDPDLAEKLLRANINTKSDSSPNGKELIAQKIINDYQVDIARFPGFDYPASQEGFMMMTLEITNKQTIRAPGPSPHGEVPYVGGMSSDSL